MLLDELDGYGTHLPVYVDVEDRNGSRRRASVDSIDTANGVVIIISGIGEPVDLNDRDD
jgi:hypothetical protein